MLWYSASAGFIRDPATGGANQESIAGRRDKTMWNDFKQFIQRGNVVDLAVGVAIGAAFGAIVNSLVNDIVMPPIGALLKGVDFSNLFVVLNGGTYASVADAKKAGAPVIAYGNFINSVITFLIVAFVVFLLVQQVVNRIYKKPAAAPVEAEPPADVKLLTEIRDLLKNRRIE
jgi:large conductance mechanosensitive channel